MRPFRSLIVFALVLAALIAVGAIGLDIYGTARLKDVLEEGAARGLLSPITHSVDSRFVRPDETANGANYYEAAIALFRAKGVLPADRFVPLVSNVLYLKFPPDSAKKASEDARSLEIDPRMPIPGYMLADIKAYVSDRRDVIDLVHRASAYPDCVYHVNWVGYQTLFDNEMRLREIARLMQLAVWIDAEEGRPEDGLAKFRDTLAMTRSLEHERLLISAYARMGIISTAISSALTRVVARTDVPGADLELLQKDLDRFADDFSIRPACETELAQFCDIADSIVCGEKSLSGILASMNASGHPVRVTILDSLPLWTTRGCFKAAEAAGVEHYLNVLDNVDNPAPRLLVDPVSSAIDQMRMKSFLLTDIPSPDCAQAIEQAELVRAKLRATAAALAALRYRRDKGGWPETLDALVPDYLAKVPLDPMTGRTQAYAIHADGILVYSIGKDGVDNGGGHDDAGFRVWVRKPDSEPPANVNE